ncbi:MAG TPA: nucleoside 2-deoxyribosyltransferase [Methanocorpusculum sp.]|nr:nucleoside 2-deoxyribosyltransferase [Methanocorpusculum sp.]
MYILASPCILTPGLRATGITTDADRECYIKCLERCRKNKIEVVPMPCPETIYFGGPHSPGSFVDRLDTPEFLTLLDKLEADVRRIIEERGERPLFILGVNSSPTCGVTTTYYTSVKTSGPGMFLKRFDDIPLLDAVEFAKSRVYLAAPLFSEAERAFNLKVAETLKRLHFEVHLPQALDDTKEARGMQREKIIYQSNLAALKEADIVVGVIDGADADSGTAWEMGYAAACGKRVIALRTDFRRFSGNEAVNLMLEMDAEVIHGLEELEVVLDPFLQEKPVSINQD